MLRRTTLPCPTCGHDPLYSSHRDRRSPIQYYMCGGCNGAFEHPLSPPEPEEVEAVVKASEPSETTATPV